MSYVEVPEGGRVYVQLHSTAYAEFKSLGLSGERFQEYTKVSEGARYVRELRKRLTPIDKVASILVRLRRAGFDVEITKELRKVLQERTLQEWLDKEALKERIAHIDADLFARTGYRLYPYQRTGSHWLARMFSALLADEMGLGKLASKKEPVLTPSGWRTMGELKVGDFVIGSNGKGTRVAGVFPQGRKKQYRVTLSDGAWTKCGAEHLWYVETTNSRFRRGRGRVITTRELMTEGLRSTPSSGRSRGNLKWFVPIVAPVAFVRKNYALDPYAVGALIANGCLTASTPIFAVGGDDQLEELARVLPRQYELRRMRSRGAKFERSICARDGGLSFRRLLVSAGLTLVRSPDRRIPRPYLLGSVVQRWALLQGFMDNDGTVTKDGLTSEYNTTSPGLAEDILELVRSLGGVAWMSTRKTSFVHKGERKQGRPDHRIRMSLPAEIVPFRIARKVRRYKPRTKYPPAHAIESIAPLGVEDSVCIRVEAADRLYVTRDYILTHNTLEILVALPANVPVLVVCPAVAKGDWRGELRKWRPGVSTDTLYGRSSFRWPRPGEVLITNYEILPDIHDRDGLTDAKGNVIRRACDGKLPAEPCKGCKERITWLGPPGQAGSQMITMRDSHKEDCEERGRMKEPYDCPGCHPFLATAPQDLVVVYDEAHKIKHWKSQRTRKAYAIADAGRKKNGRTWAVTGTPIENEPSELWTVARVIGSAEASFGSHDDFVSLFKGRRKHFGGYEWGVPGDEVVERLQRFMLRRLKHDVLPQLPRKTWGWHEVKLDVRSLREIEVLIRQSGRTVEDVAALLQEQEIGFEMMSAVRAALAFAKIPAMMEIVEDFEEKGEPLVVFSAHRAPIDVLASRPGWVVITGELDAQKKTAAADSFQNGYLARDGEPYETEERDDVSVRRRVDRVTRQRVYPRGIAITIPAGSVSLTLTRACNELFVDRSWKPTENAQAEDRCVRIGQTRGTHVKTLVANHPLDERLAEIIDRKLRLIQSSVDAAADGSDAPLTEEDLESEFREVQVAIAGGRAIRRGPESDEERDALERLHTYRFASRSDERLAAELAEEAGAIGARATGIGLSSAQWCLAIRLAARGLDPEAVTDEEDDNRVLPRFRKETSSELPDGPEGL